MLDYLDGTFPYAPDITNLYYLRYDEASQLPRCALLYSDYTGLATTILDCIVSPNNASIRTTDPSDKLAQMFGDTILVERSKSAWDYKHGKKALAILSRWNTSDNKYYVVLLDNGKIPRIQNINPQAYLIQIVLSLRHHMVKCGGHMMQCDKHTTKQVDLRILLCTLCCYYMKHMTENSQALINHYLEAPSRVKLLCKPSPKKKWKVGLRPADNFYYGFGHVILLINDASNMLDALVQRDQFNMQNPGYCCEVVSAKHADTWCRNNTFSRRNTRDTDDCGRRANAIQRIQHEPSVF